MRTHSQRFMVFSAVVLSTIIGAIGCSRQNAERGASPEVTPVSNSDFFDGSKYILAEEPDGAIGVIAARSDAKNGDEIVMIGRIGGNKKPWIEGRSAFMMIDASMSVVADGEESGFGEVCLDDCCASLRTECTTLVKLVGADGRVLSIDARELLDANVDDLVVIRGHVERDEKEGTFVVIADGVHVRR